MSLIDAFAKLALGNDTPFLNRSSSGKLHGSFEGLHYLLAS